MNDRLEVVRQTKLDLAQWIASGMTTCTNANASRCLARYAAAQLETAALISATRLRADRSGGSLLRRELNRAGRDVDCLTILTRVSQAMLRTLMGGSQEQHREAMRNTTVARLLRLEVEAARGLLRASRDKLAA